MTRLGYWCSCALLLCALRSGDWYDTGGVAPPAGGGNQSPTINVLAETNAVAGTAFTLSADVTDPDLSDLVIVAASGLPNGIVLERGVAPGGHTIATIRGLIESGAPAGERYVTWSATDNLHPPLTRRTLLHIRRPPGPGTVLETRVQEFVTRTYFHGLPGEAARELGPSAVPVLERLMRDDGFKRHWSKVAETLASIGLPETFDTLRAFVWDRFHGPIDPPTFHAVFAAQVSMWRLSATRPSVVDYLERCADPNFWSTVPWTSPPAPQRSTRFAMSQVSITGLSCIATARAMSILDRLRQNPPDPAQLSNITEGIARQQRVLNKGYEVQLREEVREMQGHPR